MFCAYGDSAYVVSTHHANRIATTMGSNLDAIDPAQLEDAIYEHAVIRIGEGDVFFIKAVDDSDLAAGTHDGYAKFVITELGYLEGSPVDITFDYELYGVSDLDDIAL